MRASLAQKRRSKGGDGVAPTAIKAKAALEVACENNRALIVYESCGFAVKSANDYYQLPID